MARHEVLNEWIAETERAVDALIGWLAWLQAWRVSSGGFEQALRDLCDAGLEDWADRSSAGGGLDALAAAVGEGGVR